MNLRAALALSALLTSGPALALEAGMFLCPSPVIANNFWNDLLTVQGTGVELSREVAGKVAQKNECHFVASPSLKPINFVAGQFEITNGVGSGWASPYLYILYVNRPQE